ncbi:molecular chaperone [Pseudoxanthomonas mexicana]|uniref:fimbrial biogenesis chaperone n=1 Tax=Pseudoxanthomonas mexicana TaxID=128785 RepID=UPI00398AE728
MALAPLRWKALACAGLLWAVGAGSAATRGGAGLYAAPSWLRLEATQRSAELDLSNTGDHPLHAQVRLYRWSQEDGEERLLPTRDLAASPPLLEIPAGQRQKVRIVRLDASQSLREGSYRLIIDQLPRQDAAGPQTVLRYSTPVFIAPPGQAAPRLLARLAREGADTVLRIDNHGDAHARLVDLAWIDADGRRVELAGRLAGYVLPGQYRTWTLPARAGGYAGGRFEARLNRDGAAQPLALAPER